MTTKETVQRISWTEITAETNCSNVANHVTGITTIALDPGDSVTYQWSAYATGWVLMGLEIYQATRIFTATGTTKADEVVSLSKLNTYLQSPSATFTPPTCSGLTTASTAAYPAKGPNPGTTTVTLQAKSSIVATSASDMQVIKIEHRLWLQGVGAWIYIDPEVDIDVPCT